MLLRWPILMCAALVLVGCSTPYRPPVIAYGGAPFEGIAGLIKPDRPSLVDVLLVHGMCSYDREDAKGAIAALIAAMDKNILPEVTRVASLPPEVDGVQIETRTLQVGKTAIRFTALVWSPLTKPLKDQLAFDRTGTATDCAVPGECKPKRANINGALKDGLLNDCLADALIYEGASRTVIRQKMSNVITRVIEDSQTQARAAGLSPGPFALVSTSLGSKISFDALDQMTGAAAPKEHKAAAESAIGRLATIFMRANQMPILGLADQSIDGSRQGLAPEATDSLQRLLIRKAARRDESRAVSGTERKLALVAFTDPNDLLSYRLLPSRYAVPGIDVTDVLVSNDPTYWGVLELPNLAHTTYSSNSDVNRLIACGSVGSALCK